MTLFSLLSPVELVLAFAIAVLAGLVKGMVGFAMPTIFISGLSTVLPPDLALAGLIFPTLITNGIQALRQGTAAAMASIRRFRVFLLVGFVCLLIGAQLVARVEVSTFLFLIGAPMAVFAIIQLVGIRLPLSGGSKRVEAGAGALAGFVGGMSGVWGPPTVAYLTALETPKQDQIRIQGVIYGLGAVALVAAHLSSGVLRAETVPFSVLLIGPALLGMWVGLKLQDRIDQATFRKVTLIVLLVAALNLLRRSLLG
ncbi:MAG: sulfite exporter TauE/SafE family protein [Ruegeria sp.]